MLAKEARQKMKMDKATFSRLLDTLRNDIEIMSFHQDLRQWIFQVNPRAY